VGVPVLNAHRRAFPSKSSAGLPASGLSRSIAHAKCGYLHAHNTEMEKNESLSAADAAKAVESGAGAIGAIIKAAGNDPNARAAGGELGKAALTMTRAINVSLLPLAAVNFGYVKARKYFEERFQADLQGRAKNIPAENIVEPKPSIAGPALQGLAFSHDEPDLKEMYLNLLGSAMNSETAAKAHPAFVEIIRQLSSEDARIASTVLRMGVLLPIVEIRRRTEGTAYLTLLSHVMNFTSNNLPKENPSMAATVDNWVRLGLFTVDYDKWLTEEAQYSWVELRPELQRLRLEQGEQADSVQYQKGVLQRTALGTQFAVTVLP